MLDLKPYTGPTKLIVAFDIGTTYSGISYCILRSGQVPEIHGVTRFPAQDSGHGDAKVPTLLYYDGDSNVRAAGAEVLAENIVEEALTEGWTKAEWWKLHLRPNHMASSINKDNDLPPLPHGKSAVDVLSDFIRYLFDCTKSYILEWGLQVSFTWSSVEDSIEYIFTHPNGWEGLQQQQYRQAIERAGLIPNTPEGHSRVHMLTEGEASLHFCVPILLDLNNQSDTPGVVVIDAGGGTIDLSMFSMTSKPISCDEIAPAECRLQGSVFVTRRAKVLLQKKLQGWERSNEEGISEITSEFDRSTKLVITSDQEPAYIKVAGRRYNNPKYNISFGKLKLSGTEATGLFSDSVDAIIDAFEQQLKSTTIPITAAFFVGGFSSNDWLWSRLRSYFNNRGIQICRPDNQVNKAVAHGAVISYVDCENHRVTSRVARATYGFVGSVLVNDKDKQHICRKNQWFTDAAGDRCVPGHFESKLRKGDRVPEKMEFRQSLFCVERNPKDVRTLNVPLACYRGSSSDPQWVDEDRLSFSTLCTIDADISQAVNDLVRKKASGRVFYRLDYEIIAFFGLTELQAQFIWKTRDGERRIPATVSYTVPYSDFGSFVKARF